MNINIYLSVHYLNYSWVHLASSSSGMSSPWDSPCSWIVVDVSRHPVNEIGCSSTPWTTSPSPWWAIPSPAPPPSWLWVFAAGFESSGCVRNSPNQSPPTSSTYAHSWGWLVHLGAPWPCSSHSTNPSPRNWFHSWGPRCTIFGLEWPKVLYVSTTTFNSFLNTVSSFWRFFNSNYFSRKLISPFAKLDWLSLIFSYRMESSIFVVKIYLDSVWSIEYPIYLSHWQPFRNPSPNVASPS